MNELEELPDVGLHIDETTQAELVFKEQEDGKKVAFIGTKCVIIDRADRDKVFDGERWIVRLYDKGTFFIGSPIVRTADASVAVSESISESMVDAVCLTCLGRSQQRIDQIERMLVEHWENNPRCSLAKNFLLTNKKVR